jgi:hypothetical protein
MASQLELDYLDDAQKRVSAETLAIQREVSFPLVANAGYTADQAAADLGWSQGFLLPDDLVYLRGIFNATTPLEELTAAELLGTISGSSTSYVGPQGYLVVGRFLHVIPTPPAGTTLTLTYWARANDLPDTLVLELTGQEARLTEDLVQAYTYLDGGQPEVGVSELSRVEIDMARTKRVNRGRSGFPSRMLVAGVDPWL